MNETRKKIQELRGKLSNKDTKVVLQGLEQVKEKGEAELIPDLIQVLDSTKIPEIHSKALEILNTLKSQEAANKVLETLKQVDNEEVVNNILASCWKNGLDYSKHFDFLINFFIDKEFENALEAFTIIENSTHNISNEKLEKAVTKIKNSLDRIDEEKKPLMVELTHLLENRKTG